MLKFSVVLAFAAALMLTACGNSGNAEANVEADAPASTEMEAGSADEAEAQKGPEWTSAYICPMHCEGSGSDAPGNCPVCAMAYVPNPDLQGGQEEGHEGHNH